MLPVCHGAQDKLVSPKIIEGALALDKLQMHQPAGRIVNVDEQGALRTTGLEPPVLRAIDLDQFTDTLAAIARLMNRLHPLLAILPKPGCHHPLPDRLAANGLSVSHAERSVTPPLFVLMKMR